MNAKQIIAALSIALVAGSTFAAGPTMTADQTGNFFTVSSGDATQTSSAVRSEVAQKPAAQSEFVEFTPRATGLTRMEVAATSNFGSASDEFVDSSKIVINSGLTRAEVRAELAQSMKINQH